MAGLLDAVKTCALSIGSIGRVGLGHVTCINSQKLIPGLSAGHYRYFDKTLNRPSTKTATPTNTKFELNMFYSILINMRQE